MIVSLAWNLRHLEANSQIMIIGWASMGVLIVDLAHTLAFPGMPDFGTASSPQKAITFWLAGRVIAAAGFLLLALLPTRHWSPRLWLPGVVVVSAAALIGVWVGIFHTQWVPIFYVPDEGLTSTKRLLEYLLSATYAVAAALLLRRAVRERSTELAWLATASWTLMLAELYFTLYVDVADVFNLLGHVLKVVAYAMVYRAVFAAGVQAPYRRLARETSLLRSLIDSVPDLVSYTDQSGRYVGFNRAFSRRAGVEPQGIMGRTPEEIGWTHDRLAAARRSGPDHITRFRESVQDDRGQLQHFDTLQTPYHSSTGEQLGVIEISRDVTAQEAAEERIRHLAMFDQLTGLPNRVQLVESAANVLGGPSTPGQTHALVLLDLDDFKTLNETLGHRFGDLIIQETARRLARVCGRSGQLARLGGDEFAVLVTPASLEEAAEFVHESMEAIDQPYQIEQYDLAVSASAGIAMYPTDGRTFDELSVRADAAMYRAKEEGRHGYRFFSGDMLLSAAERLELLAALRRATDNDEFVLHYQPQVSLSDGAIVGLEALVRWVHPEHGLLMPSTFIPVAEESGLIVTIGDWVLNQALAETATRDALGCPPVPVSVNLSAVQFLQTDLVERVRRALMRSGIAPARLRLEVTETMAMANPEATVDTIEELHELGVRLSIDDFGTGYSSLTYLKRFRVDEIKIDRSFVTGLGSDASDRAIVDAVIRVASALNCLTVAEGIETRAQADRLQALGCSIGQGFLFYRPMPADTLIELLQPSSEPPSPSADLHRFPVQFRGTAPGSLPG